MGLPAARANGDAPCRLPRLLECPAARCQAPVQLCRAGEEGVAKVPGGTLSGGSWAREQGCRVGHQTQAGRGPSSQDTICTLTYCMPLDTSVASPPRRPFVPITEGQASPSRRRLVCQSRPSARRKHCGKALPGGCAAEALPSWRRQGGVWREMAAGAAQRNPCPGSDVCNRGVCRRYHEVPAQ